MSSAREWIELRLASAPALLLEEMRRALDAEESTPLPEQLAQGAARLYRRVLAGPGDRRDALPLLAADALFTAAFQAQAELDPAALARFASRWEGEAPMGGRSS